MSQQSNSRQALATVLGTVTSTFGTVNASIGMLNRKVTDAAVRQDINSKLNMAIFKATVHQEKAQEYADSLINIDTYMAKSERHAELYKLAHAELALVLNPAQKAA